MNNLRQRTKVAQGDLDTDVATTGELPSGGADQSGHRGSDRLLNRNGESVSEDVNHSVVDGLSDDQLWFLLRRFEKEIFIVRTVSQQKSDHLDLCLSPEAKFSSKKLRSQFERLYIGVILGVLAFLKHMSRIQSWLEPRRTATFCIAYFTAWYLSMVSTLVICACIAMILSVRVRTMLFPPVPMSLVDWRTGGLSKPAAGVLGSLDSATGAPETFRGEAIEKEAESFATALAGIAVSVWTAQDEDTKPSNQLSDPQPKDSLPRLQEPTTLMSIAMDKAYGVNDPSHDKTREPMQTALWSGVLPFLRFLYIVSDTWERLANALDPTPPFPSLDHKLRLAALLVLLALGTTFVSLDSVARILSFALGVGLFARPPLTWAISSLEQRCPGWSNLMSPEHHIFRGIPTNAQLAITLLRSAENHVSPLPLRPHTKQSPTIKPIPIPSKADAETWEAPLGASQADLADAAAPDQNVLDAASGPCSEIQATERRKPHRLFGLVKGGIKSTVEMTLKADKLRAKAGHQSAKNRIGILPHKNNAGDREPGPWIFAVRHDGKEGRLHIGADGTISFNDAWTIHATEITELKKHDGLGFKARVVVGWAMDLDVKDGLEITDRSGKSYVLTAVPQRDQLFNRLCAIGGQKWDVG